jgi:hypothetical protein
MFGRKFPPDAPIFQARASHKQFGAAFGLEGEVEIHAHYF